MKISTILEKIDENQLFVPAFQREYVWKRDNAKQLIDSLIKEHPTGTMLTWETANPPKFKGPHEYNDKQGAVKLLLDGQQRVTTLYMLIRGVIPPYYTGPEIMNDTRDLFVQLETLEEKGETVTRQREDRIDDNTRAIENILAREFPEVHGLEPDYHSLGGVDRDKFELHLRNLLNQQFGAGFVTSKLVIEFHEVGEKEVCQIETAPAKEPVILKVKDKNGQPTENFYARSGNSSQEIPLSEMNTYIKERFHSRASKNPSSKTRRSGG